MLRVDPQSKSLASLGRRTLQPVSVLQRYSIAELIAGNPGDFFEDLGLPFVLLSSSLELPSGRRVMLAADPDGRVYVLATQRKGVNLDLIEPLEDASQLSRWSGSQLLARLTPERNHATRAFLQAPGDKLNAEQGVLLVGESFDLETLAAAGWLRRRYNVNILCFRARMAVDSLTGHEYLACRDLGEEVERVYLQQKSDEDDGAPWPTISPEASIPETDSEDAAEALQADVAAALTAEPVESLVDAFEPETITVEASEEPDLEPATGDPLDDILSGKSLVRVDEPEKDGSERRVADRREDLQARRLRLDYFGKLLGARLVDFSRKGIGVEALSPLPVGAEVGISGELIGHDGSMGLDGRVKVKHCKTGEDGVSRIGLELDDTALRLLENQEFFDRR